MTNNGLANELAIHNFTRREKASASELKTTFKQSRIQKIMPIKGLNIKGCLIFVRIFIYFLIFKLYLNNKVRSQSPSVVPVRCGVEPVRCCRASEVV